mgnify:CR=1 FL=1
MDAFKLDDNKPKITGKQLTSFASNNNILEINHEPIEFINSMVYPYTRDYQELTRPIKIANIGSGKVEKIITMNNYEIHNFDYVIDGTDIMTSLFNYDQCSFDAVTSTRLFEHIPIKDMIETLYACYSVLRPNGLIFIAVPDIDHMGKLFGSLDAKSDWFQRYNILNSIIYHQVTDKNGVLVDSHKTVWNSTIMQEFLEFEDNFTDIQIATPIRISNQNCHVLGIGTKNP